MTMRSYPRHPAVWQSMHPKPSGFAFECTGWPSIFAHPKAVAFMEEQVEPRMGRLVFGERVRGVELRELGVRHLEVACHSAGAASSTAPGRVSHQQEHAACHDRATAVDAEIAV